MMVFTEGSDESDAQLFDEQGKLVASGKYAGQKKTGEWKYMANNQIISTEIYLNGKKNGTSKRYYKTGELLEEANWQDDRLHGNYRSYFQDGKPYLECKYAEGKRNGAFKTSFPNGELELDAFYTDDVRDKDWNYYDQTGKLLYTLKYELGNLLNPEVQDSLEKTKDGIFSTKESNIPDPEKFMQNPEEYMQLMKIQ
jgi:antitoxin component YwqK of YwqJK toxin-antitoxin module